MWGHGGRRIGMHVCGDMGMWYRGRRVGMHVCEDIVVQG